jgi:hypothetical protein
MSDDSQNSRRLGKDVLPDVVSCRHLTTGIRQRAIFNDLNANSQESKEHQSLPHGLWTVPTNHY